MIRSFSLLIAAFALASCSVPRGVGSPGRDALGHRPGPQGFRTVVLDAGHGGHDSGASSRISGDLEKNLALDVTRRIRRLLSPDFRVVMMRDRDVFVDLDERVARASQRGDAVLVSVHFNAGPRRVCGPETFYWRVDSYSLARRIERNLLSVSPAESGSRGLVRRRLRLTRNPEIPCVLVECGYLTHPTEARRCASPAYRQRLAIAIAAAIREQAAHGDAGMGRLPPPLNAPPSRATDPRE